MATKDLKVDELRMQLAQRGLSTAGIKPTLVRRLEAAIRDDSEKSAVSKSDSNTSRKRQRESNSRDADSEAPQKIKAVDEMRSMSVKQLREEASVRGVSAGGTKKELLERLCAGGDNNSSDNGQVEDDSKEKNVDSHVMQKVGDVDELRAMNINQLREEASVQGVSAAGTKKELIERLCAGGGNNSSDNNQAKEDSKDENADSHVPQKVRDIADLRAMNIKQLREEAVTYGISAAGTKKELLERLCADNDDASNDIDPGMSVIMHKRCMNRDIDDLRAMNVKQLREEAGKRGISAAGTKKELMERLCADNDDVSNDNDPVKKEEEKIVTATKKGSAVLDKCLPDHIKAQYHVLQLGDEIYDAMLNQTNVGQNNNKFFVIQVLESDDGGKFMVYFRWGRVGLKGQDKLNGPYTSQEASISMFEKKFSDKTKNHWCNRNDFVTHPHSYTWLEMDYSETKNESTVQPKPESTSKLEPTESKLEARIAKFISLICNMSMMRQQMMEIGYNAEKLPLGKLSKSTILKGYDVLKRLADVIGRANRKTLEQLSGEFYTVEALAEIEVALKLIEDDTDMEDPLYSQYRRLHCDLTPIEVHSDEFSMIQKYTKNTHAKTHSNYDVDIIQIFKVSRECEAERFKKFSGTKNRMLLWHGSRLTNWTGILSQGLRIAPPEAPVTGYMFGKGVYFADMFSKSANYCCSSTTATSGVLLLCEVALGDMAELLAANYHADKLPAGKLSTKGVGATAPDLSESLTLEDGVVVPLGRPKEQPGPKGSLFYNEYIVYNVEQIRMRYVVQVNFNYK
ncbi:poly [ADP-ribose] polymerase 2 [Phtheirospermum japonicum]|uniref:Poly [ADP-ribose] polymerase n=1 Tax=Phtheirospermum japonicum TaxID=374723 RepID=A0A830BF35_9LAMI|nr:poly [ADP-ribose] polymerase 2 [Phtheirospermum japonicum]